MARLPPVSGLPLEGEARRLPVLPARLHRVQVGHGDVVRELHWRGDAPCGLSGRRVESVLSEGEHDGGFRTLACLPGVFDD